jgi:hypothetical protein
MKTKFILPSLLTFGLEGCVVMIAGTLGGFDERTFPISKESLSFAITQLYEEHPQYRVPKKWQQHDNWNERGYDFLDADIFYFSSGPEEMYYVTYIGDSITQTNPRKISIAIRAIYTEQKGWQLERDFRWKEKEQIEERFNREIIAKLEEYAGTKALRTK